MLRPLLLAPALVAAALAPAVAAAAPSATLSPTAAQDFSNRQVGGATPATKTFTVTSTGADPLTVSAAALTGIDAGAFTLTDGCSGHTLPTGATCTVVVGFAPTTTGTHSAALQVTTDGGTLASAALTGTGRNLTASASALDLGAVAVGQSATRTITLTNADAAPYPLGALSATSFTLSANGCAGAVLAPGASCSVDVTYAPTRVVAVASSLAVAAFGPAPVTLAAQGAQPATAIAPATQDFGDGGGDGAPRTFTLTNSGNLPLDVGAAEVSGPAADDFAIAADGCSHTTVAPRSSCTVALGFAPAGDGWRTAALRIPTSAVAAATVVARLSGWGAGAGVTGDPLGAFDAADQPVARFQGDGGDGVSTIASGGCDVNADGYDDLISGAALWSRDPVANSWEGAAYVAFGGPDFGSADLAASSDRVLRIEGTGANKPQTGAVGCLGDVNGDGIDDIGIGAWAYQYDGRASGTAAARGRAYVVFGARDLPQQRTLDLALLGGRGFTIVGADSLDYDHLGYAITGVGDLDGDGLDDLAVLANAAEWSGATPARDGGGTAWIVPGQRTTATVDVSVPGATLMAVHGASPGSTAAPFGSIIDVAPLGDVNGDGVDDLGFGSYTATALGRAYAGAAWAVSGASRGSVDLADASTWLTAIGGAFANHRLGISVRAAGDVNGDGLADLLIGADSTAAANSDAAYVVYGSRDRSSDVLDSADLGDRGYRILGAPGSATGYAVSGLGDVNHDGYDDQLVGAYTGAGSAWVVYGQPQPGALPANDATSGLVPVNADDHTRFLAFATLTDAQGSRLDGQTAGERFGRTVGAVGDVDGNGATDFAVGSDMAFRLGRTSAGEVAVVLRPGPAPTRTEAPPTGGGEGGSSGGDAPGRDDGATTETENAASTAGAAAGQSDDDATGPRATKPAAILPIVAARTLRPDARGRVVLTLRCPASARGGCAATVRVRAGGGRSAARGVTLAAGRTRPVRLTLGAVTRRALAVERALSGVVVLAAGPTTRTTKVTVKR